MGKTCVVGAKDIEVDPHAGRFRANGRVVKKGQLITVDGTTGRVILGAAKLVEPKIGAHYTTLMGWADERRRLRVRANADTPQDAERAREFGAEGVGRSEEHTSELQSRGHLVCRLLLEKKKKEHRRRPRDISCEIWRRRAIVT